jgi:hypothetical protein
VIDVYVRVLGGEVGAVRARRARGDLQACAAL